MPTGEIKSATASDQDRAVAVVVLAFSADPVGRWTYPDPSKWVSTIPRNVIGTCLSSVSTRHDRAMDTDPR